MLKWLRKNIALVGGILVGVFIIWTVGTALTMQAGSPKSAGQLFGRPVALQDFVKALEAARMEGMLRYGDRYRQFLPDQVLQNQAWERLILLHEAKKQRIRVSDREVVERVQQLFGGAEGFRPEIYKQIVQGNMGITPRAFEEQQRESLMIAKLIEQALGAEPEVTETEILALHAERLKSAEEKEKQSELTDERRQNLIQEIRLKKRLEAYQRWHAELLERAGVRQTLPAETPAPQATDVLPSETPPQTDTPS